MPPLREIDSEVLTACRDRVGSVRGPSGVEFAQVSEAALQGMGVAVVGGLLRGGACCNNSETY